MEGASRGAKFFEDLHVFQEARKLANQLYGLTRQKALSQDRPPVLQMRRAAVSVLSNISEGFERGTDREFVHALFIAKGSCGELRAQVLLAKDQEFLSSEEAEGMIAHCRQVSAGIANLIKYLRRPSGLKKQA